MEIKKEDCEHRSAHTIFKFSYTHSSIHTNNIQFYDSVDSY